MLSRKVTRSSQSVRAGANQRAPSFRAAVPVEWAGRLPAVKQKSETKVAIITYSDEATLVQEPVPPDQVRAFFLRPDASTNEAAGLRLARQVRLQYMPQARLNLVILGDGEATSGGGPLGDDKEASLAEADILKQEGTRITTIGLRGPTMDFNHLRSLASTPALAFEAQSGQIARVFVHATQSLTSYRWGQTGAEFVIFMIDQSGSMDEQNKKEEVEEAVRKSIALLASL